MKINKKVLFSGIGIMLALLVVFYLGSSIIPRTLNTLVKADTVQAVSVKDSLLIGEKMMAKAGGEEKCVVNVFVLDKTGKGIKGKVVQLSGLGELEAVTDANGKALFELVSTESRQYELSAQVDGVTLNGKVTVTFR